MRSANNAEQQACLQPHNPDSKKEAFVSQGGVKISYTYAFFLTISSPKTEGPSNLTASDTHSNITEEHPKNFEDCRRSLEDSR